MEAILDTWSVKDLKAECQKHGMAQYGDKSKLIQRILDKIPGKRKPGPKPGVSKSAIAKKTSGKEEFAMKQRKALVALGITDKKAQDIEIAKRWAKQSTTTTASAVNIKTYPIKLDQKHMNSLGLTLVGQSKDALGNTVFKYKSTKTTPAKTLAKTPAKTTPAKVVSVEEDEEEEQELDDDGSDFGSERSDDLMDDDTFKEYQEKLAARLADRRVPKKLLIDIIKAFDPEQKLSGADKTELSERAVEQLMYETDDEQE